ncbi:hypothetical protein GXW78_18165 [Roseomonas terrae]|uniref:Uncharacterized protein n=1 Tax=Neoroseomonas terrae TaxID=424799 RepID=A0ABS5EKQ7_9PROT|nr:hypothetical protein [Neoroseomonas terrae]MBR0651601.1 hypothetical protein [Neoroseomonas terrae]
MDRNFGYGRRDFTAGSRGAPIAAAAVTRAAFPTRRRELAVIGPADGAMTIGSDVPGANVEVTTEDGATVFQERLPDGSAGDTIVMSIAPSPEAA